MVCKIFGLSFNVPFHVIRGARMQGVLLFLNPEAVSEDVVALGLLPQVVELDQLTHRPVENIKTGKRLSVELVFGGQFTKSIPSIQIIG